MCRKIQRMDRAKTLITYKLCFQQNDGTWLRVLKPFAHGRAKCMYSKCVVVSLEVIFRIRLRTAFALTINEKYQK